MLLAVVAVAFAIYLFDCGVTMTAKDATQCCKQMPCSSHGHHDQNCCKSMPTMQVSFVQSASSHIVVATVLVSAVSPLFEAAAPSVFADKIGPQSHAPPALYSESLTALRI